MILKNATILYKGYDPANLSKGSNKKICVSRDKCGRIRYVNYKHYRSLCRPCSKNKKITLICQQCGKKYLVRQSRKTITKFCSKKCYGKWQSENLLGKNSPNWQNTDIILICQWCQKEFKTKQYKNSRFCSYKCKGKWQSENLIGENTSNWQGGISNIRDHVLSINQCIKLNKRFNNSEFHHITKSIGIYIPKELHQYVRHNLRTGKNMESINMLALQFINGGL